MEQFITDDMEEIEGTEQEESASFSIDNDQKADWAIRKIMDTENAAKMWKEYYKKQSDRVEKTTQQRIAYFTALLESYFDTVPHKVTKTSEKYKLPSGVLVRKAQAPEYERDDAQIIAWCEENAPSCVENVPKLKWTSLKGLFEENNGQAIDEITGEVVPGIKIIPRDPVFAVQKG